jgi:DNA-binding NtrC family response regulator
MDPFKKLQNMKTLLIDDDETIRDSLGLAFQTKDCRLLAVKTAEDGLEALKKERFDIIIADYSLPGMDGIEFLKLASNSCPNALNLLITAYDDGINSEAFRTGVHDFMRKPFSFEKLIGSLARLIERRTENRYAIRG